MRITVKLYASLSSLIPQNASADGAIIDVKDGTKVNELLEELRIPKDSIKIVFLNGVQSKGDEVLKEGDRLAVFPPIAGG